MGYEQMSYERFTERARKVMKLANDEAQRLNHEYVAPEHILLGLIKEGSGGVGENLLRDYGIDLRKVRAETEKLIQPGPDIVTMGKLPLTPLAKKAIEAAQEISNKLSHNHIGTEHLLYGISREYESIAGQALINSGFKSEDLEDRIRKVYTNSASQQKEEAYWKIPRERIDWEGMLKACGYDIKSVSGNPVIFSKDGNRVGRMSDKAVLPVVEYYITDRIILEQGLELRDILEENHQPYEEQPSRDQALRQLRLDIEKRKSLAERLEGKVR